MWYWLYTTEKSYYSLRANQQKANLKLYSRTQYDFGANRCVWRILVVDNAKENSTGGGGEGEWALVGNFWLFSTE